MIQFVRNFAGCLELNASTRRRRGVSSLEPLMANLLEFIALAVLVVVSLGGFLAAIAFTFAIWFGQRG